jgi:uncharacterized protein YdhG (YjbR/CyaY superfamily)
MKTIATKNIDEYIAAFPEDIQSLLEQMRATIKKAAPRAEEAIKYGMPAFTLNGNLVFFAGYKNHIGFYPAPRGVAEFKKALSAYGGGKGTLKFPIADPLPLPLITKIVKFRVQKNLSKTKTKEPQPK